MSERLVPLFGVGTAPVRRMRTSAWEREVKQLTKTDVDREEAEKKADRLMHQEDKADFSLYRNYMGTALDLRYSDVTNAVLDEAEIFVEDGMSGRKAIKRVLAKHKLKFEELFESDSDSEDHDSEDDDNDDSEDNDSEDAYNDDDDDDGDDDDDDDDDDSAEEET